MQELIKVSEIVKIYRHRLGTNFQGRVNQDEFAEMLVRGLVNIKPVSQNTISAWENDHWEPETDLLLALVARYAGTGDWRAQFAQDCLKAKLPEVFEAGVLRFEDMPVAG